MWHCSIQYPNVLNFWTAERTRRSYREWGLWALPPALRESWLNSSCLGARGLGNWAGETSGWAETQRRASLNYPETTSRHQIEYVLSNMYKQQTWGLGGDAFVVWVNRGLWASHISQYPPFGTAQVSSSFQNKEFQGCASLSVHCSVKRRNQDNVYLFYV